MKSIVAFNRKPSDRLSEKMTKRNFDALINGFSEQMTLIPKITTKAALIKEVCRIQISVQPERRGRELRKVWDHQDVMQDVDDMEILYATIEILISEIHRIKTTVQPEHMESELHGVWIQQDEVVSNSEWKALCDSVV
jgi:hypothetical protein